MFFKRDVTLAQEYLAFTLLNLFDLFLSGYIFKHHGMEANGLAAMIYSRYHSIGFVVFKFFLVLVVILACEGISLRSVRKARLVVTFGCLIYVLLVLYESVQIFVHITGPRATA